MFRILLAATCLFLLPTTSALDVHAAAGGGAPVEECVGFRVHVGDEQFVDGPGCSDDVRGHITKRPGAVTARAGADHEGAGASCTASAGQRGTGTPESSAISTCRVARPSGAPTQVVVGAQAQDGAAEIQGATTGDADGDGRREAVGVAATGGSAECEGRECGESCDGAVAGPRAAYTGRRINIDLVDADVHSTSPVDEGCTGAHLAAGGLVEGPVIVDDDDD